MTVTSGNGNIACLTHRYVCVAWQSGLNQSLTSQGSWSSWSCTAVIIKYKPLVNIMVDKLLKVCIRHPPSVTLHVHQLAVAFNRVIGTVVVHKCGE